jgi:hypothetical protein
MTIRISFSDKTVRVAVEINGAIESAITELPQRKWVGLTDEGILKFQDIVPNSYSLDLIEFAQAIEAKLKEKNSGA